MRAFGLFAALCVLTSSAWADDEASFPYTAYVNSDDVYIRSGPGKNYYPTDKLARGDTVEVYRHDPGGWWAVRPPRRSFSWVAAKDLKLNADGLGVVQGDRVHAHVGTAFSEVRDVIQVKLDRDEEVEVLETKRLGSGVDAETWYKIAPPAGEFRWVSSKFLDREAPLASKVRPETTRNLLVRNRRGADTASDGEDGDNDSISSPGLRRGSAVRYETEARGAEFDEEVDEAGDDRSPARVGRSDRSAIRLTAGESDAADVAVREPRVAMSAPATRRGAGSPSPLSSRSVTAEETFQAELDDIDLALSVMVAEEPSVWSFEDLHRRTDALLDRAETALERGRARMVITKLMRFEALKQRYEVVATTHKVTDRKNVQVAATAAAGAAPIATPKPAQVSVPTEDPKRFDGQGKLTPVVAERPGMPRYALIDSAGQIAMFVDPGPGVNLQPYVGRQIGIAGQRGFHAELNKPVVTAQRVLPVEGAVLR